MTIMRQMVSDELVDAHRARGLSPDHPVHPRHRPEPRRLLQRPGSLNNLYAAVPGIVEKTMAKFAKLVGREYKLFDYSGAPDAERIVDRDGLGRRRRRGNGRLPVRRGEKVGVLKVRLFRPFSVEHFIKALPADRQVHRRPGSHQGAGRPRRAAVPGRAHRHAARPWRLTSSFKALPTVIGGRYGLASKEFTPTMAKAVFDELKSRVPRTTSPSACTTT